MNIGIFSLLINSESAVFKRVNKRCKVCLCVLFISLTQDSAFDLYISINGKMEWNKNNLCMMTDERKTIMKYCHTQTSTLGTGNITVATIS